MKVRVSLFEQSYNMVLIDSVSAQSVEELQQVIDHYIEQKSFENE